MKIRSGFVSNSSSSSFIIPANKQDKETFIQNLFDGNQKYYSDLLIERVWNDATDEIGEVKEVIENTVSNIIYDFQYEMRMLSEDVSMDKVKRIFHKEINLDSEMERVDKLYRNFEDTLFHFLKMVEVPFETSMSLLDQINEVFKQHTYELFCSLRELFHGEKDGDNPEHYKKVRAMEQQTLKVLLEEIMEHIKSENISVVAYADDCDPDMEHEIMPSLNVFRNSNH